MALTFRRLLQFLRLPFSVQWRTILVRLPRLVPLPILYFTSPEGPYPSIVHLPSRGSRKIPVYVFLPFTDSMTSSVGLHLDFHGGGFTMGSCLEQAPFCALLARRTGRLVLSIDYRKGPLDQFPAAIEDAEDVLAAVLDSNAETQPGQFLRREIRRLFSERHANHPPSSLDPTRLSISGFSSGGNLAQNLVLSVSTADLSWPSLLPVTGPPVPVLLFYPSFDSRILEHERPRPTNLGPPGAFAASLSGLSSTYLPNEMRAHPRASPGLADLRTGLHPRTKYLLILSELDALAQQSEVWIRKMKDEGKEAQLTIERARGMRHGWTQFPEVFLTEEEIKKKTEIFDRAIRFINHHFDEA
jgi:acetyl esterase/lipase